MPNRMRAKRLSPLLCVLSLFLVSPVVAHDAASAKAFSASTAVSGTDDDPELQRLLSVLDKYTEIATKTRMNADFVPGMVTVLDGDHLVDSGKRNVWEALAVVPGIEPFVESTGARSLVMRGAGVSFASGNIKVLVNGIPQNNNLQGKARPVMSLPTAQVERIEVIRGPGAVVHGEYAYTGVINVITRSDENRVFVRAGEDDRYGGGATLAGSDPRNDWQFSLSVSAEDMAAGEVTSGPDSVAPGFTNAPGPVNDARDAHAAILALSYRGFSLDAQYIDSGHGEQFGVGNALPLPDDRVVFEHTNTLVEARQQFELPAATAATLRLGWFRHEFDADQSVATINPLFGTVFADADYEEQQWYGGLLLEGRVGDYHELLLDVEYREVDVRKADQVGSNALVIPQGLFVDPDKDREHLSIALQDQIILTDGITLTAGLRYDDYNDVGSELSPRLAAVWRLSNRHVLKAQYAEAFRPPTFIELYTTSNPVVAGNSSIEPTDSRNYELGYIFNGIDTTARATLFHTELDDLISVVSGQYVNAGDARLRGLELELEHAFSEKLSVHANASYTDTEDKDTNRDLRGAADWLANLGVRYRLHRGVLLDAHYRYVDERARGAGDTRSALDDYQVVDLTANFTDVMQSGLTLRVGVRNMFDEDYAYPALPGTYPDDYPQRGRQWWLQGEFTF